MKRLLFVDDEPRVLEGIENSMFDHMDTWEMVFVSSGEEALKVLAEDEHAVLVTDMMMPAMDGAALLTQVKKHHPGVVRFVLSGHAKAEAALRALPITHQFFSKPCEPNMLIASIERACSLTELISDEAMLAAVGDLDGLPVRPQTYSRLVEGSLRESWCLNDIADEISKDVSLATKVMQVANSPFFSSGRTIGSLNMAVSRLGSTFITNLVLSMESFSKFKLPRGMNLDQLQEDGLAVGTIAKRIAPKEIAADCFLAGLIHDLGHLALAAKTPEAFTKVRRQVEGGDELEAAEREVLGTTHGVVGGFLLSLWGMPLTLVEAVTYHHDPARIEVLGIAAYVHIADRLHEAFRRSQDGGALAVELDSGLVERLGVGDQLGEWERLTAEILGGTDV